MKGMHRYKPAVEQLSKKKIDYNELNDEKSAYYQLKEKNAMYSMKFAAGMCALVMVVWFIVKVLEPKQ